MRVALIHNENAGSGMPAAAVRRAIVAAGHEVVTQVAISERWPELSVADTDVVAVAGGDGTVREVATRLAGSGLLLAAIPLGTANNIAASLGFEGDVVDVVRAWGRARRVPFDLGRARGPWGECRFIESAGAGLVARGIAVMDSEAPHPEAGDRYEMLRKSLHRFGDVLAGQRARRCRLTLDGVEHEESLLLAEVLNVRSVGPRLGLAPASRTADGVFDVVTAGERERAELASYLHDRARGRPSAIDLPTRRAARVELVATDPVHLDDRIYADAAGAAVLLAVESAALVVLSLSA